MHCLPVVELMGGYFPLILGQSSSHLAPLFIYQRRPFECGYWIIVLKSTYYNVYQTAKKKKHAKKLTILQNESLARNILFCLNQEFFFLQRFSSSLSLHPLHSLHIQPPPKLIKGLFSILFLWENHMLPYDRDTMWMWYVTTFIPL